MTFDRTFLNGFWAGLLIFLAVNLLAAHLLSDCGLPALFGSATCADDVSRAGFPHNFPGEGGFAHVRIFNIPILFVDILAGFGFPILCGFIASAIRNRQ